MDLIAIETNNGKRFVNLEQIVDARWFSDGRLKLFTVAPDDRGVVVFEGAEAQAVGEALELRAQTVMVEAG